MAKYTNEFKKEIAELHMQGAYTLNRLAAEYGVCIMTIVRWTTAYRKELLEHEESTRKSEAQELNKLQQENTKLKEENDTLKEEHDFLEEVMKSLCSGGN